MTRLMSCRTNKQRNRVRACDMSVPIRKDKQAIYRQLKSRLTVRYPLNWLYMTAVNIFKKK